ncbi:MAG TPA: MFS transporter [Actinocrinis sp.]|uniref:MFS transporter n=1 Tax=Actinocrinis sp. TaxID=1920516 RepID=UPI002DDCF690|nr:MFS transporter [Actinocrinis sp.]HEV3170403.1 MFS transporter [Actinocrinis sp.]
MSGIDAELRRARGALFVAFGAQGFSLIALTSEIPALKDRLHINDSDVSMVMAAALVFAAVGSLAAGALVGRFGSRIILRISQLLVLVALIGIGAARSLAGALPFMLLIGAMIGAVDATTNMQAVALQRRYGRSIILAFHGVWAVGAAIGSLAATLATDTHTSLLVFYTASAIPLAAALLPVGRYLLRGVKDETIAVERATAAGGSDTSSGLGVAAVNIPWRPMLAVCAVMALAYFADSTVSSAGGLYIQDGLHGHGWQITIVYFAYAVPFMAGRFVGDRLTDRFGGVPLGRAGSAIAALGFVVVMAAPAPLVALLGFAVVGLGISVMAPLCFSAAGRLDPADTGIAVARLNIFNYVGFLFGSALVTGLWGAGVPHRAGIAVPLAAAASIAAFAYGFSERRTAAFFSQRTVSMGSQRPGREAVSG